MSLTFTHTADMGDIIACLPSIRAMGGGELIIGERTGIHGGRESLRGARYESLAPLLSAQPYIDRVSWSDTLLESKLDFSTFRANYRRGENLAQQQARHVGTEISETPWLVASPSERTKGRAVLARSKRYHNPQFPWDKVLLRHKDPLFVGLPDEYQAFQTKWGRPIEHHMASSLLELAGIIYGCSVFIGNQSCPAWIAMGLGVPLIQESWAVDANSIIERSNAKYCLNGTSPL